MTTKRLLSEDEILKMGDKDYMNEDQLAFFRSRLEQLQADEADQAAESRLQEETEVRDTVGVVALTFVWIPFSALGLAAARYGLGEA